DLAATLAADDLARVADLTARLRVARRPIQDHLDGVALARLAAPRPVPFPDDDPDARRRRQRVVAEEALRPERVRDRRVEGARALLRAEARARAGALPLALHLLLECGKALRRHRPAGVLEDLLRQVGGKPVGVVEREQKASVRDLPRVAPVLVQVLADLGHPE